MIVWSTVYPWLRWRSIVADITGSILVFAFEWCEMTSVGMYSLYWYVKCQLTTVVCHTATTTVVCLWLGSQCDSPALPSTTRVETDIPNQVPPGIFCI